MKAWILDAPHTPLRLADVAIPTPGPGQVLVEVRATGLCHSDVGYMKGVIPYSTELPIILGHEPSGVIAALGDEVTGWQVGDAVVAAVVHTDAPGVTHDGAFAQYYLVTAAQLVKLPAGIDWGQAAAATDAGVTSYTGVVIDGGVRAGDRVGIVGLGGLGMTGARIAVIRGATVYGADPKEDIWATALEQGVEEVFEDVSEFQGLDLDVIVDFAGFGATTAGAIKAVKKDGRVVVVGLGAIESTINTIDLVSKSVTLKGSTPRGQPAHLQEVIAMVSSGQLTILATRFDDIPDGLERLQRGEVRGRLYATPL